jgi:hypothetical protein
MRTAIHFAGLAALAFGSPAGAAEKADVLGTYADIAEAAYGDGLATAGRLQEAVQNLIAEPSAGFLYSYQIQPDGSLAYKQPDGHLHRGDATGASGADGMTVDSEGRLYVASAMGVQVLDQMGRVHFIISKPQPSSLSNVVFGGPELNYLYATCRDKVYRRKLAATGAVPWKAPFRPTAPRL